MAVRDLQSQEAETDNGVILRSIDRWTMEVEYRHQVLNLPVERGETYCFYLPESPRWNDGSAVPAATLELLKSAVVEIQRHWGIDDVEFQTL